MSSSPLFVVGKRDYGVLFIRLKPLRVTQVTDEAILQYEEANPGMDGYAAIAAAAKGLIVRQDGDSETGLDDTQISAIRGLVADGTILTDVDFALAGDVVDDGWTENRWAYVPLENVAEAIGPAGPVTGILTDQLLKDA